MTEARNMIAEGSTIKGGASNLRLAMKLAGFAQVGGIYSTTYSDGTSTFRAVSGTRCGALGHNASYWTLRQVWGA